MKGYIDHLDDQTAIRILAVITQYELETDGNKQKLTDDERAALEQEFGAPEPAGPVSDGDLARAALELLACDDKLEPRIRAVAQSREAESFDFASWTDVAMLSAVLAAARTGFDLRRDADGKWTAHIYMRPLKNEALTALVQKLLSWVPGKGLE